jgi:uncharacterized RDD family membrane protein YckC
MIESGDGWFVADRDGQAQGPMSRSELQQLRESGKVGDEHLVWTLRQAEWVPLRRALGNVVIPNPNAVPKLPPSKAPPSPQKTKATKAQKPTATHRQPTLAPGTSPHSREKAWAESSAAGSARSQAAAALLVTEKRAAMQQQASTRGAEAVRRFLARQIDLALFGGIGWALLSLIGLRAGTWALGLPQFELQESPMAAVLLLVLVAVPIEGLALGLSGYTPGRWLLGLRVVDRHGGAPGLATGFNRAVRVALVGQALLILPFVLIANGIAFGMLMSKGRTHWDQALGLSIRLEALTSNRWMAALAALVILWVMLFEGVWMRLVFDLTGNL